MKAHPVAKTTKRNPQDATRRRDVAPLRRRIDELEANMRAVDALFIGVLRRLGALEAGLSNTQGKRRRSSAAGRR